ncbi:MAG: hypothetical protein IPG44_13000 [Anaerolineales bacterium]|nr:hypothetical protein [Anaerolineales bacterium]
MFAKNLVANRGEIAIRVMRAPAANSASKPSPPTSEADKNAQHVQFADEAAFIGNAAPKESF